MKAGAFGDCYIEPVAQAGAKWYKYLTEELKVDAVIPMTHQFIGLDREMAKGVYIHTCIHTCTYQV